MLSGFGEKPPQETVENAVQIASNKGIFPKNNTAIKIIVIKIYMFQSTAAEDFTRGVNFPSVGPGDSAENI